MSEPAIRLKNESYHNKELELLLSFPRVCVNHKHRVTGIIHVGAHLAEEAADYRKMGVSVIHWVEGLPDKCEALRKLFHGNPAHHVHEAWLDRYKGLRTPMWRASNGMSSSLREPQAHLIEHPNVNFAATGEVTTTTLDDLMTGHSLELINTLVMDVQGAEHSVMAGGEQILAKVGAVYMEINTKPLYAEITLLPEMDSYMLRRGFLRLDTCLTEHGWGDAFYLRK